MVLLVVVRSQVGLAARVGREGEGRRARVEPLLQGVSVGEGGVGRDGSDKSCIRGQSTHGCLEELGEDDIVGVSAVSVH